MSLVPRVNVRLQVHLEQAGRILRVLAVHVCNVELFVRADHGIMSDVVRILEGRRDTDDAQTLQPSKRTESLYVDRTRRARSGGRGLALNCAFPHAPAAPFRLIRGLSAPVVPASARFFTGFT